MDYLPTELSVGTCWGHFLNPNMVMHTNESTTHIYISIKNSNMKREVIHMSIASPEPIRPSIRLCFCLEMSPK